MPHLPQLLRGLVKSVQRVPVVIGACFCVLFLFTIYSMTYGQISPSSVANYWTGAQDLSNSEEGSGYEITDLEKLPPVERLNKRYIRTLRWTYECKVEACIRREAEPGETVTGFDVCWLTCGTHGSTWPFPKTVQKNSNDTMKFLPRNFQLLDVQAPSEEVRLLIEHVFKFKQSYFESKHQTAESWTGTGELVWRPPPTRPASSSDVVNENEVKVSISTDGNDQIFNLDTNESYELSIYEDTQVGTNGATSGIQLSIKISGPTFFGIRHGIETLSQLIVYDEVNGCLQIVKDYYAKDQPAYRYRGILIDSARNFVPISVIKRVIDGMSINKLNILHWHLSDSNSFTFYSKSIPQMSEYGAMSEDLVYRPSEIEDLVKYATLRGVKIVPELDAPSHAGNGWQFGEKYGLGKLAFYANLYNDSWPGICGQPPCGILNLENPNVYEVLERIYRDMTELFGSSLFHMGGDEVNIRSWRLISDLKKFVASKEDIDLWKFFQTEAFNRLRKNNPDIKAILWTSKLTESELKVPYLNRSNYIIQVWEAWDSKQTKGLLDAGFSLIMSFVDKFYLDWGYGTWLGREHLYTFSSWQKIYDARLSGRTKFKGVDRSRSKQILGGEATLWGEKVGPFELEIKLWPRAAALGENLWSNPNERTDETYTRINYHNYRMRQRGIPTSQLQPVACLYFNGHCRKPHDIL